MIFDLLKANFEGVQSRQIYKTFNAPSGLYLCKGTNILNIYYNEGPRKIFFMWENILLQILYRPLYIYGHPNISNSPS